MNRCTQHKMCFLKSSVFHVQLIFLNKTENIGFLKSDVFSCSTYLSPQKPRGYNISNFLIGK